MKVIKRFKLVEYNTKCIDDYTVAELYETTDRYGGYQKTEFDTEEEAIQAAYERSKYREYLIVPIISFSQYEEDED